jgi:transcriptional regulator with XRE-family HTH domain
MMMKPPARILMLALGIAGSLPPVLPSRARAQAPESDSAAPAETPASTPEPPVLHADVALAERNAAAAFEAYRTHEYGRAINLYEQALAAAPSADILYNIARVYDVGLRDRRLAIQYYERYRSHPSATPELFETATRRLAELRAAEAATSVPAADGANAIAREFPVDSSARPRAAPVSAPSERGLHALEVTALAFGAAGLVGIGLGIGFGLSARSEEDTWGRDCNGNQCNSQRGVDAAESAARSASIATVGFAVGGGLLAVGTVLWLIDTNSEVPNDAASLRITPALGSSSVGGTLSGRF